MCVCVCMAKASYINASNAENMKNVWHVIKHTAERRMKDACARNKMKRPKAQAQAKEIRKSKRKNGKASQTLTMYRANNKRALPNGMGYN